MSTIKCSLFAGFLCFSHFVLAQENKFVTEMLKSKYTIVLFHAFNEGGYYNVSNQDDDYNWLSGACNLNGEEIVPLKYDYVMFWGDCFVVGLKYGKSPLYKLGIIDLKGKILLPCEHLYIMPFRTDPFNLERSLYLISDGGVNNSMMNLNYPQNSKFALYDVKNEKFITNFKYDYIEQCPPEEKLARFNIGGKITSSNSTTNAIVKDGKWGYLNDEGEEVISAQYDVATPFKNGVAQVTLDGVRSMITNPITGSDVVMSSLVDTNIPQTNVLNEDVFAFVFANENYSNLSGADFSIKDGKIFSEYCRKTLGVSENNVRYYEDATYGNFMKALSQIKDIADVYEGDAKFIFYFSGLGMTDERTKERFLLPSDAQIGTLTSTGVSIKAVTDFFNSIRSQYSLILIDAPFNGKDKIGKMLSETRGVQIAAKTIVPSNNVVVALSGGDKGDVYVDTRKGHGLFTYSLLEKLQADKGKSRVRDVLEYVEGNVKKQSLELFNDVQSPKVSVSKQFNIEYQSLKF